MRHCVRLGILHEIESEFSKIEVRMTKLWLPKVSEIFRVQNSSNSSSNSNFKTQTDWVGNFPPSTPGRLGSRLGSRHPQDQVDCAVDLGVDLVPEPGLGVVAPA